MSSLIIRNKKESFLDWIVTCDQKIDFYPTVRDDQLSGCTKKKLQSTFQSQTCTRKGNGHYLVVYCPFDPLQLSESWQNHYIWEACSANQQDALKTVKPAAGIGQQKEPNFSLGQGPTAHHTTSASKVKKNKKTKKQKTELWSFTSSAIFTWWPLTNQLPLQASW